MKSKKKKTESRKKPTKKKEEVKSIKLKEKPKDKAKNNTLAIITIFVILAIIAMVIVSPGFKQEKKQATAQYNGFMFFQGAGGAWFTYLKEAKTNTIVQTNLIHYLPSEVKEVKIDGSLDEFMMQMMVSREAYITFNPEQQNMGNLAISALQLSVSMKQILGVLPIAACTKNVTGCEGAQIKSCENADKPVIELRYSEDAKITQDGNCLLIEGQDKDLIKATSRAIYGWYGIMN